MAALDVLVSSFKAMTHVFLVSLVGFLAAIYCPKSTPHTPLLPPEALRLFSRMSISCFAPALILYSTSRRLDSGLLFASAILAFWSLFQNIISYNIAKLFRRFHSDVDLAKCIEVAVGTPNQIALPIMVLVAMCKDQRVNEAFNEDPETCSSEAMSMLFVFATGFHLFFWSWGYVVLSELKLDDGGRDVPGGNENAVTILGVEKTTTVFNKVVSVFKKSFLNHLMIAMYFGIFIAVIPGMQDILYSDEGLLRPVGDTIETISTPCVALNCLVMAGSLALTRKKGGRGEAQASKELELVGVVVDEDKQVLADVTTSVNPPPIQSIVIHSFLRLLLMPAIMNAILWVTLSTSNIIPRDNHLLRLIISVEAASPSAQLMIVSLNQLNNQKLAGQLAYVYFFHYLASIVTITGWVSFATKWIYG